ncbi:hypothetical protein WMF13_11090 [Sorangium sp. So ce513]
MLAELQLKPEALERLLAELQLKPEALERLLAELQLKPEALERLLAELQLRLDALERLLVEVRSWGASRPGDRPPLCIAELGTGALPQPVGEAHVDVLLARLGQPSPEVLPHQRHTRVVQLEGQA